MARPIPVKLSKRDPQEELRFRLERAPDEHAAALLAGLDLLEALHGSGRPGIAAGRARRRQ
jgi:hypothetical protein